MDLFKLFSSKDTSSSKNVAKERLQFVLVHDRVNCSPKLLEMIKEDMMGVISEYVEIDREGLEIKVTKNKSGRGNDSRSAIIANIPIKKMKK